MSQGKAVTFAGDISSLSWLCRVGASTLLQELPELPISGTQLEVRELGSLWMLSIAQLLGSRDHDGQRRRMALEEQMGDIWLRIQDM